MLRKRILIKGVRFDNIMLRKRVLVKGVKFDNIMPRKRSLVTEVPNLIKLSRGLSGWFISGASKSRTNDYDLERKDEKYDAAFKPP